MHSQIRNTIWQWWLTGTRRNAFSVVYTMQLNSDELYTIWQMYKLNPWKCFWWPFRGSEGCVSTHKSLNGSKLKKDWRVNINTDILFLKIYFFTEHLDIYWQQLEWLVDGSKTSSRIYTVFFRTNHHLLYSSRQIFPDKENMSEDNSDIHLDFVPQLNRTTLKHYKRNLKIQNL